MKRMLIKVQKKLMLSPNLVHRCYSVQAEYRQHDYENFLATLLMTNAIRSPAFVVRAFNVEVARIQDQTQDAQTAAFRLHFWQDVLKNMYDKDRTLKNIPANPVAQELYKVCWYYNLPRRHLEKLINSRKTLMKNKCFLSTEDLEGYAEQSVSSIYYLLLYVAGIKDIHADHAASHLGKAQGIVNILRSIHVFNHQRMVAIPMDILMDHKTSQEAVLRSENTETMRNIAFDIASRANNHLKKARSIAVPKLANQILLPAVAVQQYLTKLEKCNFNVYDPSLHKSNGTLPLKFYMKRIFNTY